MKPMVHKVYPLPAGLAPDDIEALERRMSEDGEHYLELGYRIGWQGIVTTGYFLIVWGRPASEPNSNLLVPNLAMVRGGH